MCPDPGGDRGRDQVLRLSAAGRLFGDVVVGVALLLLGLEPVLPSALQFLIVMLACSLNERMQKALDYKSAEVIILKRILQEVTGKQRIDFTEEQRTRLALFGKAVTA